MVSATSMRRFQEHKPVGRPLVLDASHPAAIEGRSYFGHGALSRRRLGHVFVSGHNSRKIGKVCVKGQWRGMPIFTLTLEERHTCPRSCDQWLSCYGNKMHWSVRLQPGQELEAKIETELAALSERHPRGFIIRLHVLGDFYSVNYVTLWRSWLRRFPALRVFGYTARDDMIGAELRQLVAEQWDRFAVRSSNAKIPGMPASVVIRSEADRGGAIVCPAQTGKSDCCGTCALCWSTTRTIAFLEH
jgi:hypothetical protein